MHVYTHQNLNITSVYDIPHVYHPYITTSSLVGGCNPSEKILVKMGIFPK